MSIRLLTDEQIAFFRQNQYGLYRHELANLMNETFGLSLSVRQVKYMRRTLNCHSGITGTKKGDHKVNKGTFKQGHRPHNAVAVGTRLVKGDGYLWEKVAEPNKWKQVHRLIWGSENGKVPDGYCLIFLNKNRLDVRLDNLALVSRRQIAVMNRLNLRKEDKECTEAGIAISGIMLKCADLKRKERKQNGDTK